MEGRKERKESALEANFHATWSWFSYKKRDKYVLVDQIDS